MAVAAVATFGVLWGCERDAGIRLDEALSPPDPPSSHVKFVHVHVLTDGGTCSVETQEVRCDVVAAYLRDDRHTALSEPILVLPDGTGKAAVARAEEVRSDILAMGYSDVWTIGFLTSPDHPNPDP